MPIAVMIGYLFVISVFLIYSFEESIYSSSNENGIAEKIKFVSTKASTIFTTHLKYNLNDVKGSMPLSEFYSFSV